MGCVFERGHGVKVQWPVWPEKKSLENTSWEDISIVSRAGLATEYWNIGDTKSMVVNGLTYYCQIIGFDHDTPTDTTEYGRGRAGITFQFGVANDSTKAGVYSTNARASTLSSGWPSSSMRSTTLPNIKNNLESQLVDVIVLVNKITGGNTTTSDDLFLLSNSELTGGDSGAEGEQYEYYQSGGSTVRYLNGSAVEWWLRTVRAFGTTLVDYVNTSGGVSSISSTNTTNRKISFAFCV